MSPPPQGNSGSDAQSGHSRQIRRRPLPTSPQQDSAREVQGNHTDPVPTSNFCRRTSTSIAASSEQGGPTFANQSTTRPSRPGTQPHQRNVSGNDDNPRCPEETLFKFNKKDDSPDNSSSVELNGHPDDLIISSDEELTLTSLTEPPPAYRPFPQTIDINREGLFNASAAVACDGRIDIKVNSSSRKLLNLLTPVQNQLEDDSESPSQPSLVLAGSDGVVPTPKLNIAIQIVGSRGDVQPFLSLGLALKHRSHRVRIATHPVFQSSIEDLGLEFFSIGGDPAELMAFMCSNPGLMPNFETVRKGKVQKLRHAMQEILRGCWRSCFEAGNGLDAAAASACPKEGKLRKDPSPFVADAIIANPPAFAHIHCAEKLGIPLHLMFTMPWSPTQSFAHPLANVQSSTESPTITNYISYLLVEMLTWQGLGDVVNKFRRKVLGLEPIDPSWAPGMIARLQIPHTYCWSPILITKPKDWGKHIEISGFFFLPLASSYAPPPELESFLQAGPPPVYIGFGSIVVGDPDALTQIVFEAVRLTKVRAVISKGWGGLGGSLIETLPHVFMLDNCPHDWLFPRVSCVVHHGGAGTTAAGLAASKPTVVVPFFGDQPFWGDIVAKLGVGPRAIPAKFLTASSLAAAITAALQPVTLENARILGRRLSKERGAENGMKSFLNRLPLGIMGCSIMPHRAAAWQIRQTDTRLSVLAATVLRKEKLLDFHVLKLFRPCEYDLNHGPWDPVTGGTLAIFDLFYDVFKGLGEIGSEFTRIPNVGQRGESSKSSQSINVSALPPTPSSSKVDDKIVGERAAKGLGRMTKAALRSPMTFSVGMAQGAHNLPKLWGDKTVRPQEKITGIGSGLKAAGKELFFGTYDGFSGLITQPINGACDEGAIGATKGFGKGIMGACVKPFAAMSGVVGYSLKGIDAEFSKGAAARIFEPVLSARVAQGELEYLHASKEEKTEIIQWWYSHLALRQEQEAEKKKMKDKGKGKEQASGEGL